GRGGYFAAKRNSCRVTEGTASRVIFRYVVAIQKPVPMPTYKFKIRNNGDCLADECGIVLSDAATAHRYACKVARELMRCRETATRHWRLEVYQDGEGPVSDILFASVDPTLDHRRRATRTLAERVNAKKGRSRTKFIVPS